MKRRKCSFVGLLVSLALAHTPPTYAQLGNMSNSTLVNNDADVFGEEIGHSAINVVFDGLNLSWQHVMNIAKDPVISWGAVRDERGNWIQGEVWLIVARNDKFIYYHLTDTPNSAKDSTSHNGYTVKAKATMTIQFYSFGFGGTVPLIGNDTDAFLVTTTEIMANSAFTDGETVRLDFRTGAEIDYLVYLYDTVESYGISSTGSRGSIAIQHFAPDGTELVEPYYQFWSVSASSNSSSSTECEDQGEAAGDFFRSIRDLGESVDNTSTQVYGTAMLVLPPLGPRLSPQYFLGIAALGASQLGADLMRQLVDHVGAPAVAALAEGACEARSTGDDFPVLPIIELDLDVDDVVFGAKATYVCDRYETVLVGSNATDNGAGGVDVTGHEEQVCAEGHFEVVEEGEGGS